MGTKRAVGQMRWGYTVVAAALLLLSGCGVALDFSSVPGIGMEGRPEAFVREYERRFSAVEASSRSWKDVGLLAQFYHANGFLSEALILYSMLQVEESQVAVWPYLASRIQQDFGRTDQAASLLETTIALEPRRALPWYRLAELSLKTGKVEAAERAYSNALELSPKLANAMLGLARVSMTRGEWARAGDRLHEAIQIEPDLASAIQLLSVVLENLGLEEQASSLMKESFSRERAVTVSDDWLDALDAHCFDPYLLRVKADRALKSGQASKGIALLQRALAIDLDDAQTYFDLAKYYRYRDLRKAASLLESTVGLEPKLEAAWHTWVAVLQESGDLPRALSISEQSVVQLPASAGLLRQRGVLLEAAGSLRTAERLYKRSVALEPHDAENHETLGNFLWARGRKAEAAASYKTASRLSLVSAKSRAMLATYAMENEDFESALGWIHEAEKADGGLQGVSEMKAEILLRKANRLARLADGTKAQALYIQAFRTDPSSVQSLINYAALLSRENRNEELQRDLFALSEEFPTAASLFFVRAQLEAMGKRYSEALSLTNEGLSHARRSNDQEAYRLLSELRVRLRGE